MIPRNESNIYDRQLVESHLRLQFAPSIVSSAGISGLFQSGDCQKKTPSSDEYQHTRDYRANIPLVSTREICEKDSTFRHSSKVGPSRKRHSSY